jgi:hypothetical protein
MSLWNRRIGGEMQPLTEKELLPELKRRISGALKDTKDKVIHSDGCVLKHVHTIHFTIRNENYLIEGIAMKRIYDKDGKEIYYKR